MSQLLITHARVFDGSNAFVVPTMVILEQLVETGRQLGFAPQSQAKAEVAWKSAIASLDIMRSAGVKLC